MQVFSTLMISDLILSARDWIVHSYTMSLSNELGKNDKGFTRILGMPFISLVRSQIPAGFIAACKFIDRISFFLFIIIPIGSLSLRKLGKSFGCVMAGDLLLVPKIMPWTTIRLPFFTNTAGATGCTLYIVALLVIQLNTNL